LVAEIKPPGIAYWVSHPRGWGTLGVQMKEI